MSKHTQVCLFTFLSLSELRTRVHPSPKRGRTKIGIVAYVNFTSRRAGTMYVARLGFAKFRPHTEYFQRLPPALVLNGTSDSPSQRDEIRYVQYRYLYFHFQKTLVIDNLMNTLSSLFTACASSSGLTFVSPPRCSMNCQDQPACTKVETGTGRVSRLGQMEWGFFLMHQYVKL